MWWVPALIFVLTSLGGVLAAARWLPELRPGRSVDLPSSRSAG